MKYAQYSFPKLYSYFFTHNNILETSHDTTMLQQGKTVFATFWTMHYAARNHMERIVTHIDGG